MESSNSFDFSLRCPDEPRPDHRRTGRLWSGDPRTVRVVGQIIPWNFPLAMVSWKIAPALAAGNCTVIKPAEEQTPLSILRLMELIEDIIPDGVINVVTGYGEEAGEPISKHEDVRKLAFTGSTAVGKQVMRNAADTVTDVTLELGGKSPVVVHADADPEEAVQTIAFAIFANTGECCEAGSRLFVHEEVADDVLGDWSPPPRNERRRPARRRDGSRTEGLARAGRTDDGLPRTRS